MPGRVPGPAFTSAQAGLTEQGEGDAALGAGRQIDLPRAQRLAGSCTCSGSAMTAILALFMERLGWPGHSDASLEVLLLNISQRTQHARVPQS